MKRVWRGSVVVLALSVVSRVSPAPAQMPGMYQPPVSPYINLLRGGASPAVNYFNIVQPQLEFGAAIGQLQTQQAALGQSVGNLASLGQATGHPVQFGNYLHYYSARGIGVGTGAGLGGVGFGGVGMGMGGTGMMGMGGIGMGGMGMMGMGGMGGMGMMGMGGMGYGR